MKRGYFKNFRPFQHDNLGYKQKLYELAKETYRKSEGESSLASALLFASIADYMAIHLLMSLRGYVKLLSQTASRGVIYYDPSEVSGANLNKIIEGLKDYSFPMKIEILEDMHAIKDARNRLFHEMAMINPEDVMKLDDDINTIASRTDSLVGKIDLLYANYPAEGSTEQDVKETVEESVEQKSDKETKPKK